MPMSALKQVCSRGAKIKMRLINRILFFQLVVFTVQCRPVSNESEGKVVGGTEDYTTFPAAIGLKLYSENGEGGLCTGTVVTDELVMTAAHCILPPEAGRVKTVAIYVRESDLSSPPTFGSKSVSSSDIIVHPNYVPFDPRAKNFAEALSSDVAFIRFTKGALAGFV
jgi:secreted trypsin-like serine protease